MFSIDQTVWGCIFQTVDEAKEKALIPTLVLIVGQQVNQNKKIENG